MARMVPDIIQDYARAGMPFVYTLDIEPSAPDSWLTKRYATASVNVDGDAYDDALFDNLSRITSAARIEKGGTIAELGEFNFRLKNKNKLHELFINDNPTNRKCIVKMCVISPNRLLNSTFGKYSGANFENWIETVGGGGFAADTGNKHDGTNSLSIISGSPEPLIASDAIEMHLGEQIQISFWMRGTNPGDTVAVYLQIGGFWYNATTQSFHTSKTAAKNIFTVIAGTTWERKSFSINTWDKAFSSIFLPVIIQFEGDGNNINIDAVQIEIGALPTTYHHNRYELDVADMLTVYTGVIQKPRWNKKDVYFKSKPWGWHTHHDIPITLLTTETNSNWDVPDDNIGIPFPMTYGDYSLFVGAFWDDWHTNYQMNAAAGILVNIDPDNGASGVEIYFDRPGMAMGPNPAAAFYQHRLYHYDKKAGRYYEQVYDDRTTPIYVARELTEDLIANARFYQHASAHYCLERRIPWMIYMKGNVVISSGVNINNPANAIDANWISYASMTTAGVLDSFRFNYVQHELEHTIWLPECIYFIGDCIIQTATGGAATGTFKIAVSRGHGLAFTSSNITVISGGSGTPFRNTPINRAAGPPAATHKLTDRPLTPAIGSWNRRYIREVTDNTHQIMVMDGTAATSSIDMEISDCGLRADFCVTLKQCNFGARMYGRAYGTTWNARKTAAAAIIEPVDALEGILRHELGAVDADINMDAFDSAHNVRKSTNYDTSYQLLEVKDSKDIIRDWCEKHGCIYWIDHDGKHTVAALGHYASIKELHRRDFDDPDNNLTVEHVDPSGVITGIHVKFDYNAFIDSYAKEYWCGRNGSSTGIGSTYETMCGNNYAALGNVENILHLDHDWSHRATPASFIKFMINWNKANRLIVSGDVFMDKCGLEIGDIVTLAEYEFADWIPATILQTSRFVVCECRLKRSQGRIGLKLLEVKPFV